MSTPATKPTLEKPIVDPEDELDDLDDLLPEFGRPQSAVLSPPPAPPPTATTTTTFGRQRTNTRVDAPPVSIPGSGNSLDPANEADEELMNSDFAKELALGMESLMREIAAGTPGDKQPGADSTEEERTRAFKAAWEAMLVEGMDDNMGEGGSAGHGEPFGAKAKEEASGGFQDKIKQAMDKLKESETKFKGASGGGASGAPDPESFEALLKSLGDLGLGEGEEDEGEFAGFLENMMGELMGKNILYEPLKELAEGFPPYLEKPPAPISAEDRTRYENQLVCVRKILAVFEKAGYSDSSAEDQKQIVDLMSEMQSYGTPPAEIMGPLPPGLDGTGGIPGLGDENCTIA